MGEQKQWLWTGSAPLQKPRYAPAAGDDALRLEKARVHSMRERQWWQRVIEEIDLQQFCSSSIEVCLCARGLWINAKYASWWYYATALPHQRHQRPPHLTEYVQFLKPYHNCFPSPLFPDARFCWHQLQATTTIKNYREARGCFTNLEPGKLKKKREKTKLSTFVIHKTQIGIKFPNQ